MEDAGPVGLRQSVSDLDGVLQRLGRAQAPGRNQLVEGLSLDALHHDEVHALLGADVVDGDDVGMVEGTGRPSFLDKALLAAQIGDLVGRQDFDRHRAVEVHIASLVDHPHAALAELRFDPVVVECPADHGKWRALGRSS